MNWIKNIAGGLAGAIALNVLQEAMKHLNHDAPNIALVGEEGLNKALKAAGGEPLHGDKLFNATLAADLISNTLYYSMIGVGKKEHLMLRGAAYGLAAGAGALKLTKPLGLSDAPVTKTDRTKVMTVAWYLFGGLVAAATIKALKK
jgi:hypothetical protein